MIKKQFVLSKCAGNWCKVKKRRKIWDSLFYCKDCQVNLFVEAITPPKKINNFISIPFRNMHLSDEQRAFLLKQEKQLQQKREDIWALIWEMYIWDIIDYLKWSTDNWRYESWIHTKIMMKRPWKLSNEIPYEINALNYSKYAEIIEYVHYLLFSSK